MASRANAGRATAAPDRAAREKRDAGRLLDMVFGADILAAIHEGFPGFTIPPGETVRRATAFVGLERRYACTGVVSL